MDLHVAKLRSFRKDWRRSDRARCLTLTLISEAFPLQKRASAIGLWGGIAGLAVAAGPVASVFIHNGGYAGAQTFIHGFTPAVWVGVAFSSLGIVAALLSAGRRRPSDVRLAAAAVPAA
jgi:hypothetical protein